uniref:Puratrophin-1 n=1 Tax=Leptobrachium leishanense TaxID=445787 RepID=A0A8C5QK12_9ANUR
MDNGCIQKALSSLYPPFELTAATVLCQVLDVVEKTYRGDGLSYLIDFLIPAKHVLQVLQQEACLQYCGLLFRHAGWPLCIQDKVVLQLASIDWRLLRPGDFYLQVVPYLRKTPRIVLKCLAYDQHHIEELVLPQVSYTSIFTPEWLEFINSGRMGTSLENCLLMSDEQLYRVPWDSVVQPEFIVKAETAEATKTSETRTVTHEEENRPKEDSNKSAGDGGDTDPTLDVGPEGSSSDTEGEYVDLADLSVPRLGPQLGSLTQSIALNFRSQQRLLNQRAEVTPSRFGGVNCRTENETVVFQALGPTHCPLQLVTRSTFIGTNVVHQDMDPSQGTKGSDLRVTPGSSGEDRRPFNEHLQPKPAGGKINHFHQNLENPFDGARQVGHDLSAWTANHHCVTGAADAQACRQTRADHWIVTSCQQESRNQESRSHFRESTDHVQGSSSQESGEEPSRTRGPCMEVSSSTNQAAPSVGTPPTSENPVMESTEEDLPGLGDMWRAHNGGTGEESKPCPARSVVSVTQGSRLIGGLSVLGGLGYSGGNLYVSSSVPCFPVQRKTRSQKGTGGRIWCPPPGLVYLPGTRDRGGRALVIINTRNTAWLNPRCNAAELGRLLLYFHRIPRRDCRALGLTLLVDARRCSPVPALFKAFHLVQATLPTCIHGVLLLVEKDLVLSEKPHGVQFDLLTSTKSLHKHVDAAQLPPEFDGSFPYCHTAWLAFRVKLEHLLEACRDACSFLQNAMKSLHAGPVPDNAEEANQLLNRFGQLMRTVLEDKRLVKLQSEGGATLARIRKEESCVTLTEDYKEAVEAATDLYNRVDEGVHSLVKLSNKRIQDMELLIEFEAFEEHFREISGWIDTVGERSLGDCVGPEDSLEVVLQAQRRFLQIESTACEYCRRGREILQTMERWENVSSPETQKYRLRLRKCKEKVEEFSARIKGSRECLEKSVRLYHFFDKAYEWALDGMRHLASISLDDCNSPALCGAALEGLERYRAQHPEIDEKVFEEMRELACELKSERGAKQWKFAWSKCQEARHVFEKKLEAALRAKSAVSVEQPPPAAMSHRRRSDSMEEKVHCDRDVVLQKPLLSSPRCPRERRLGRVLGKRPEFGIVTDQAASCKSSPLSSVSSIVTSAFRARKMSLQSLDFCHQETPGSATPTAPSRPLARQILRKAQSFDLPGSEGGSYGCQRRLSEPARRGNTGVFIKGLEVSSTELAERPCSPHQPPALDWSAECLLSERRCSISTPDGRSRSSKLRHIIDEMVTTEREYVRSLWYISENYFPEMERLDLPQDLRGKRGIIFGNLEKLRDFHSQYFLKELESCCNHPLRVSHCFLRHKDQFGMYALYSKNKPRSDQLLASHGNLFFKNKQRLLGDKMDLASYLLKPIQRMSKYALLLKDLIKECGEAQEQELAYLRAAEEMVKFQLRHGNDLLAMDAIRDCDVNLKEQGQLVRQDEFTVWLGRKKCQRHVFLFEDLILFSKPRRIEGGLDVYIYKRSFKTADIGLTESSGDSGLRFEIWFRRRKSNDTHILQASNPETKQAWTCDIAKILWQQASRNKEIRVQEMVSMGVGNKPFLDITPSDAAINNRAIDYIMKGRGARTRASIAVSLFDHSDPYKRTQAPITCSSAPPAGGPSSASLLGPLNLHMYVNQSLLSGVLAPSRGFETSSCLEEDELENETSSSQPSMTTESSGSSQCMSGTGSSGSDSGCVSGILQDNLSEDAASPSSLLPPYSPHSVRHHSSLLPPSVDKSRFLNHQYISANASLSLSPSTIV